MPNKIVYIPEQWDENEEMYSKLYESVEYVVIEDFELPCKDILAEKSSKLKGIISVPNYEDNEDPIPYKTKTKLGNRFVPWYADFALNYDNGSGTYYVSRDIVLHFLKTIANMDDVEALEALLQKDRKPLGMIYFCALVADDVNRIVSFEEHGFPSADEFATLEENDPFFRILISEAERLEAVNVYEHYMASLGWKT